MKDVSFRFDVTASGYDAPFVLAKTKGWYKQAGFHNVSFGEGNGSGSTISLVATGKDTFGWADFGTMMISRQKGAHVKGVMMVGQDSPLSIVTLKGSGITKPKDLEGKTLLLNPNGASAPLFKAFLRKTGIDKSKITIRNNTSDLANSTLLAKKRVDAYVGWQDFEVPSTKALGATPQVMPFRKYGVNVINTSVVTSDKTLKNAPNTVDAFVSASLHGWNYSKKHPKEAIKDLKKAFPAVDTGIALGQLKGQLNLLHTEATMGKPIGWAAASDVADSQKTLRSVNLLKKKLPVSDYYTDKFIPR
jgi:NitT/TauT family transport system substrate-binding protein